MHSLMIKSSIKDYKVFFNTVEIENLHKLGSHFLIDKRVYDLYNLDLPNVFLIEAVEFNKNYNYVEVILKFLLDTKFRKNDKLVAIGGGIVQDLTSFIATIWMRGINWIFVPSTLLAQTDSCIGSKSSLNFGEVKNILGTFNPPDSIYILFDFLKTLDWKDINSGLGEILKFNIMKNETIDYESIINNLPNHIHKSLCYKKEYIEIDEFDKRERQLLNFGHCVGHAIETASNYNIPHGVAVTMGIDILNKVSKDLYYISADIFEKYHQILFKNYAYFLPNNIDGEKFFFAIKNDKKNTKDKLNLIMLTSQNVEKKSFENVDEMLGKIVDTFKELNFKLNFNY